MRKFLLLLTFCFAAFFYAQKSMDTGQRTVVQHDRNLSGTNYTSYFTLNAYLASQGQIVLTPAPAGYEPFYISTYARHGSRWMLKAEQYDDPIAVLKEAAAKQGLTPEGEALLSELTKLRALCPDDSLGVLTSVGERQHRTLAERLCRNYPEVFCPGADIFAQSSKSERCVRSMRAECAVIDSIVGAGRVPQVFGVGNMQDRLAGAYSSAAMKAVENNHKVLHEQDLATNVPYERFCSRVFAARTAGQNQSAGQKEAATRASRVTTADKQKFVRDVFHLAQNCQSHTFGISLWRFFTDDEITVLTAIENRYWYRRLGASPVTGSVMPQRARPQLMDIIEGADSVVARREWRGANLRFGHDMCLLPLACLMELGTCGAIVDESGIDTLDRVWRCGEIFPMAGNLQLIFYRPTTGEGDVLVKALLNEREVTLPTAPVSGPYYRWTEVRKHWLDRFTEE